MNPGRRKRMVSLAAAVIVVAMVGMVVLWPGEREPEYQGKKLSEWLDMQDQRPAE